MGRQQTEAEDMGTPGGNSTRRGEGSRAPIKAEPGPVRDLIQRMRDLKETAGNPSLAEFEKAIFFARPKRMPSSD